MYYRSSPTFSTSRDLDVRVCQVFQHAHPFEGAWALLYKCNFYYMMLATDFFARRLIKSTGRVEF